MWLSRIGGKCEFSLGVATATGTSQVNVVWLDNASDETRFELEVRDGIEWPSFVPLQQPGANVTTYAHVVTPTRALEYRMRACNANGCSGYTRILSVRKAPQ